MNALSHRLAALSISLAALGLALPAAAVPAAPSPYFGRWTIAETNPTLTTRGREYKTIDIARCGKDFCGVSVGAGGNCGPTLFRFLMKNAVGENDLRGHGKWGNGRKNVVIWLYSEEENGPKLMELYLGDGYDFGERSGSMPKFHSTYKRAGAARCTTR